MHDALHPLYSTSFSSEPELLLCAALDAPCLQTNAAKRVFCYLPGQNQQGSAISAPRESRHVYSISSNHRISEFLERDLIIKINAKSDRRFDRSTVRNKFGVKDN